MKKILFWIFLLVFSLSLAAILVIVFLPSLREAYRPLLLQYMAESLPEAEKQKLYQDIEQQVGAMWDTIPEPLVARIGQANRQLNDKGVEVIFNNAGLRDKRDYHKKSPDEYRIICLGDSFVFGVGGKEEDRFCNQIEDYYSARGITIGGKSIKALALGLGSWTLRQEASYLASRLDSYDPDLVVILSVNNDIGASSGVTGRGFLTNDFSPEDRQWGSGIFNNQLPLAFGINKKNLLDADLSPLSHLQWSQGMESLQRLIALQKQRQKLTLLSVLDTKGGRNGLFIETYQKYLGQMPVDAPLIHVPYSHDKTTSLPHDGHPNRYGHELIARHYIAAFDQLGWIDGNIPGDGWPKPVLKHQFSENSQRAWKDAVIDEEISSSINFSTIDPKQIGSLLGGIFPEVEGKQGQGSSVWASQRSAFLLKKLEGGKTLRLRFQVPSRTELAGLKLRLEINGHEAGEFAVQTSVAEVQSLQIPLQGYSSAYAYKNTVEVMIFANRYFAEMDDHRMKSFQLVSAEIY